MSVLQFLTACMSDIRFTSHSAVVELFFHAAWLAPQEGDLYWMIPTALLILLIPTFVLSVWLESLVLSRLWKGVDRPKSTCLV